MGCATMQFAKSCCLQQISHVAVAFMDSRSGRKRARDVAPAVAIEAAGVDWGKLGDAVQAVMMTFLSLKELEIVWRVSWGWRNAMLSFDELVWRRHCRARFRAKQRRPPSMSWRTIALQQSYFTICFHCDMFRPAATLTKVSGAATGDDALVVDMDMWVTYCVSCLEIHLDIDESDCFMIKTTAKVAFLIPLAASVAGIPCREVLNNTTLQTAYSVRGLRALSTRASSERIIEGHIDRIWTRIGKEGNLRLQEGKRLAKKRTRTTRLGVYLARFALTIDTDVEVVNRYLDGAKGTTLSDVALGTFRHWLDTQWAANIIDVRPTDATDHFGKAVMVRLCCKFDDYLNVTTCDLSGPSPSVSTLVGIEAAFDEVVRGIVVRSSARLFKMSQLKRKVAMLFKASHPPVTFAEVAADQTRALLDACAGLIDQQRQEVLRSALEEAALRSCSRCAFSVVRSLQRMIVATTSTADVIQAAS